MKKFRKAVDVKSDDSLVVKDLKKKMAVKLNSKFGKEDDCTVTPAMIASALDPRYKNLKCLHHDVREKVKEELVLLTKKEIDSSKVRSPEPPAAKKTRLSQSSSEDSSSDEEGPLQQSTTHFEAAQEVQAYQRAERCEKCDGCPGDQCGLIWWKEYSSKFPNLAKVARSMLAIPATSTASERVFSIAGHIVSKRRANLSPEHVDALVCISMNK